MPTFDFRCQQCSHTFEFTRPFGSKEHPSCPDCRSKKTEKLMSPPAIVFKGEGWYKTDSRKTGNAAKKGGKKGETKEAEGKDGTKGTEGTAASPAADSTANSGNASKAGNKPKVGENPPSSSAAGSAKKP